MAKGNQSDAESVIPVMKCTVVLLVAAFATLAGTGCSSNASRGAADSTASSTTVGASPSTTTTVPHTAFARIVLPATTLGAGSSMKGRVVLENNTGHALHAIGCGFFAVALQNAHYRPQIAWASCAHRYTFPVGESSYPVTVEASYLGCTSAASAGDEPACIVDGDGHPAPPPLAPGTYQATLFQITRLVPTPPSITVHVTNMTPG